MKNMVFHPRRLHHFYNRGNNRQPIFFSRDNYLLFLKKAQQHLLPHCDILAYCLMPNHFHFMLDTHETLQPNALNLAIGTLLSSYTQAVNLRLRRTGSVFQQHSKAKCLEVSDAQYPLTCFHYIHQNPYVARLCKRMEDWEFSSFCDYLGRPGGFCNQAKAHQLLDLPTDRQTFYEQSYRTIPPNRLRGIF